MKNIFLVLCILDATSAVWGQNIFKAIVKDKESKEILIGATARLQGTTNGGTADLNGLIEIKNIPDGNQVILFHNVGYAEQIDTFVFPLNQIEPFEVFLSKEMEEMDEVVVTSTRSSRTIGELPTRVETISGEELGEKGNMKPGDIRMMLNESTGIQTQQTSATSFNSSIRIQGLDGKYTQILRDGFPLYSGFSGGLSLLQIIPLDLKQVEVIKGSASTLYGEGAIAGLVNLVSKTPNEKRELSFMLNGTSALGLDASGFYSEKFKKVGTTVFYSFNSGTPYDPAKIGLTAIPKFGRYTINPKLFFYLNEQTTGYVGLNGTIENRIGGDMKYIAGNGDSLHSYFEENKTNRFSTQLSIEHKVNQKSKLSIKNSISYYDRNISIPNYRFSGIQQASYGEGSYDYKNEKSEWVAGLNFWTDQFKQDKYDTADVVDYFHATIGFFVQNTWNVSKKIVLESGLREDFQNEYGFFTLPRISILFKINAKFTSRLSGGLGYKIPTVFIEDAERIQFRNVLPIDVSKTIAEKSIGGNMDINYHTGICDKVSFTGNVLFFYTQINNPLVLSPLGNGFSEFQQPIGFIDTRGIETNIKLTFGDFKLFFGYTLADVNKHYNGYTSAFPLVAKHRLNNVLMYEIEGKLKIGLEAYYFSPQKLNDGSTGRDYWICGLMIEKLWKHFSLFMNLENLLDIRQTKFDSIYSGTLTNPIFKDIYAPVDGFIMNAVIKIHL